MPPEAERQLAREIYQEMIAVNSGFTTGTTTPIAEAVAKRLKAEGFPDVYTLEWEVTSGIKDPSSFMTNQHTVWVGPDVFPYRQLWVNTLSRPLAPNSLMPGPVLLMTMLFETIELSQRMLP